MHRENGLFAKLVGLNVVFACLVVCGYSDAVAGEKKRSGTIIGELKSQKNTPDNKNTMIEVLAPGEEKARRYHVNYDPKIKGPIKDVLAAVRHAKVGDRVEFEWVDTNHGPAITVFKVLNKAADPNKENK